MLSPRKATTGCGAMDSAARSARRTGSESGGGAGAPASPIKNSVTSTSACGAAGTGAALALAVPRHRTRATRCRATPGARAAAARGASLLLARLEASERAELGGHDVRRTLRLEVIDEGCRDGVVLDPDQVLEGRRAAVRGDDLRELPALRLVVEQGLRDALRRLEASRVDHQGPVEALLLLVVGCGCEVRLQPRGAVRAEAVGVDG